MKVRTSFKYFSVENCMKLLRWQLKKHKKKRIYVGDAYIRRPQSMSYQVQQQQTQINTTVKSLSADNKLMRSRLDMAENRILSLEKLQGVTARIELLMVYHEAWKTTWCFMVWRKSRGKYQGHINQILGREYENSPGSFQSHDFLDCSNGDTIWIHRCHRIGQPGSHNRPIVAKMNSGRECIFKYTRHIAGTPYFVSVQMPPELTENKKKLSPLFKQAKADGKPARYIGRGDAVLINNQVFRALVSPFVCCLFNGCSSCIWASYLTPSPK